MSKITKLKKGRERRGRGSLGKRGRESCPDVPSWDRCDASGSGSLIDGSEGMVYQQPESERMFGS
jgi:hypothetical protein